MKRVLLLFLFLGILPIACFQKVGYYFNITNLDCQVFKDDSLFTLVQPSDSLTANEVFIKIDVTYEYVGANSTSKGISFPGSIYAFDKPLPGKNGLKEKLNSIKISSNNEFNGHDAGSNIKELFKWHDIQWDGQKKPIDSLVILLNRECFFIGPNPYFFKLILNGRPTDSLQHVFSFDFIYENGNHQLIKTTKINWKK